MKRGYQATFPGPEGLKERKNDRGMGSQKSTTNRGKFLDASRLGGKWLSCFKHLDERGRVRKKGM